MSNQQPQIYIQFLLISYMPSKWASSKLPEKHKSKEADLLEQHDEVMRQEINQAVEEVMLEQITGHRKRQLTSGPPYKSRLSDYSMEPLFVLPIPNQTMLTQGLKEHTNYFSINDIKTLGVTPLKSQENPLSRVERMGMPLEFPFSCIGIVTFLSKQQPYFSTGTIVSDSIILTAAHNCFNMLKNEEFYHIRFSIPATADRWYTFRAKQVFIPEEFKDINNAGRLLYNFCFIEVEADINLEDYFGCLSIRLQNQYRSKCTDYSKKAFISGYTLDLNGRVEAIKTKIKIEDDFDILKYELDCSNAGHLSGAPIISENHEIIGLHISTSDQNTLPSFGLASISWLLSDFVNDTLIKEARVYSSNSPMFTPKEPETIQTIRLNLHYSAQIGINKTKQQIADQICEQIVQYDWAQLRNLYIFGLPANFQYYDQPLGFLVNLEAIHCRVLSEASMHNLRSLSIQGSNIGDEGCRWLSTSNWNLTYLSVVDNDIGNTGMSHLLRGGWNNLRMLQFGRQDEYSNRLQSNQPNKMQTTSWKRLSQFKQLLKNSPELTEIKQNPHYVYARQLRSGKVELFYIQLLRKWKNLEYLDLSGSDLSNKGCTWIHQGQLHLLEHIILQLNNFDDSGVKWLAKSIWKKLRIIDLRKNQLTPLSCSFISNALWGNQKLNIYHDNLRKQGMRWLWEAKFHRNYTRPYRIEQRVN